MKRARIVSWYRWKELRRFNEFIDTDECYMKFLRSELDDHNSNDCGYCMNCLKRRGIIKSESGALSDLLGFDSKPQYGFCPKCGAPLIKRASASGPNKGKMYIWCSNSPRCSYVKIPTNNSNE